MASGFKNIFGVAVIIMMICAACLPEPLELTNVEAPPSKIVVSSQQVEGYPVAIMLTRSISALDGNQDSDPFELINKFMISDATVRIEGGGHNYKLDYINFGVYGSQFVDIIPGVEYTLYVTSPSMGDVTAKTIAQERVLFEELDAEIMVYGRDTLASINYRFNDAPGSNWYMLNAQTYTRNPKQIKLINPTITTKVMTDSGFEGKEKSDNFRMLFDEVKFGDTIAVTLSNVDEHYYDFMKLREDTRFGFAAVLGEPINYPTNVEGGLGFFTLYYSDRREVVLDKYGNL